MWDLVLVVVVILTYLYWYLCGHLSYWKACGVYTLPGALPGVGHMWDSVVLKKSASFLFCEFYRKAKGHPAFGIYSFRKPSLVVRDPKLIQTVLISDFSSFHDNTVIMDETIDPHISKNPFVLRGERWKSERQKLAPGLSPAKIKAMFPLIQRVCQEFNSYMEKHQQEDIDVNYVTGLFTSEVVAKCAFAVDGNAFRNTDSEFYKKGRQVWDSSLLNPFALLLFFYFPFINKLLRIRFVPKEVTDFFVTLIKQASEYRSKSPENTPDDYLQHLLNLLKKEQGFTFDDVVAQSLTFFTDGFETSSVTASFLLYELVINPEIQDDLRAEVKAMDSFTFENISALPLLDRVLQETLRKYSVFALLKETTKDTILQADGLSYPVKKGQHVIVPVHSMHYDPDIYPSPEKFDPDRFLPENIKSRHPMTFLGFGAGPRMCIGYRFATCQVKVLVANILANFRLVKCRKTVEKMKLSPVQLLPYSEEGIWAQFQKL